MVLSAQRKQTHRQMLGNESIIPVSLKREMNISQGCKLVIGIVICNWCSGTQIKLLIGKSNCVSHFLSCIVRHAMKSSSNFFFSHPTLNFNTGGYLVHVSHLGRADSIPNPVFVFTQILVIGKSNYVPHFLSCIMRHAMKSSSDFF